MGSNTELNTTPMGPSEAAKPRVAIIICSTRKPRVCKEVATFVHETFEAHASELDMDASVLDLADWPLPMLDEPQMAILVNRAEDYAHEHTRRWSREIALYQGYIFILPQYNWSFPAVIKNAIDFLFNEWKGKAGLIVSYGGRGGYKSADAFRSVLGGIHMRACDNQPQLHLSRDDMATTDKGEEIGVTGPNSKWNEHREGIVTALKELDGLLKQVPA